MVQFLITPMKGDFAMPEEQEMQEDTGKKRVRRTPEQLAEAIDVQIAETEDKIAEVEQEKEAALNKFDSKISALEAKIEKLEQKKKSLSEPRVRKPRMTKKRKIEALIANALKARLSPDEVAQRLGLSEENQTQPSPDEDEGQQYQDEGQGQQYQEENQGW